MTMETTICFILSVPAGHDLYPEAVCTLLYGISVTSLYFAVASTAKTMEIRLPHRKPQEEILIKI